MTKRYFAIFGAMRTGSNLLEKTIEALGDTVCYGEAFNPSFIGGPMKVDERGWTTKTRNAEPLEFLTDLLCRDSRLPGFRIFMEHDETALRFALGDPNCARIILSRDPLDSYISLKIARETDQWVLRYPRRRISTRVHFDAEEFEEYRGALVAHYAWMEEVMAGAGTDALHIEFADLSDPDMLERVARHIGSEGVVPTNAPLLRQNPGPLSRKVSNYTEMCEALGLNPENLPVGDALAPTMPKILGTKGGIHAFAPIDGPGFGPGVAFLNWLERAQRKIAGRPIGQVLDAAARGELFSDVVEGDLAGRVVFTIVSDPLERLYGLLIDELFGPGWKHAAIRRLLADRVGPLPEGRRALHERDAFSAEFVRSILTSFMDLIEEALAGAGPVIAPAAWHAQATQIAAYEAHVKITRTLSLKTFPIFIRRQSVRVGASVPSAQELDAMMTAGRLKVPAISDVADGNLRTRVRRLYAEDYQVFSELLDDGQSSAAPSPSSDSSA